MALISCYRPYTTKLSPSAATNFSNRPPFPFLPKSHFLGVRYTELTQELFRLSEPHSISPTPAKHVSHGLVKNRSPRARPTAAGFRAPPLTLQTSRRVGLPAWSVGSPLSPNSGHTRHLPVLLSRHPEPSCPSGLAPD